MLYILKHCHLTTSSFHHTAYIFWNKTWNNGRKVLHRQILMELGTFTPYYNQIYLITSHTWVLEAIFDGGIHIINSGVRNLPFTYHPCVCCIWLVIYLPFKSRWKKDCLNLFIVMLGGLHIEIAAFRTIGDWLQNSGWVSAFCICRNNGISFEDITCNPNQTCSSSNSLLIAHFYSESLPTNI